MLSTFSKFFDTERYFLVVPGKYRPISLQSFSSLSKISEAPSLASQSDPQDLADPIQGSGRPGVAGRLLPEPC